MDLQSISFSHSDIPPSVGGADCRRGFWTVRIGERTARQMDHLPISGPDGSLARLAHLPSRHRVYTHINNTNPMLLEDGAERALVESAGVRVGTDGMRLTL